MGAGNDQLWSHGNNWRWSVLDNYLIMPITINGSGTITGLNVGGLPDGIVDSDMIASSVSLGGLNEADQWRLTTSVSIPADTNTLLTTNWERVDRDGQNKLGTGVSESSGYFSFPSTGIWLVDIHCMVEEAEDMRGVRIYIRTTTDNKSSHHEPAEAWGSVNTNSTGYQTIHCSTLFDVTNTTNCHVIFLGNSTNTTAFDGSSAANRTYATFLRLGDT